MIDPRQIAERLLGVIDWQTEVSGLCACPGESLHTSPNGKKDCRVNIVGAPSMLTRQSFFPLGLVCNDSPGHAHKPLTSVCQSMTPRRRSAICRGSIMTQRFSG